MASIRIFDENINLIAEVDNYKYLRFERKLYNAGLFEFRISANAKYSEELQKNRIIAIDDSTSKVGIIKAIRYIQDRNEEYYIITGFELKGIFKQRVTMPLAGSSHQSFTNKKGEYVLKNIVKQTCQDTAGMEFDLLEIETDLSRGLNTTTKTRYKNLSDELERIGRVTELGNTINIDYTTKKLMFDVIPLTDNTSDSSNPVIFRTEYNNIESQNYTNSDINKFNYALVGGQGVGSARTIENVGSASTNFDLSVMFVDARDIDDSADLISRGEERLSETQTEINFDCEINANKPFLYGVDWDLGSIITIINTKLNLSIDKVVEEITEFYTETGFTLNVVFGTAGNSITKTISMYSDYGID